MKQSASLAFLVTIIYRGHQVKSLKCFSLFIQMSLPTKKKGLIQFYRVHISYSKGKFSLPLQLNTRKKSYKAIETVFENIRRVSPSKILIDVCKKKTGLTNYGPLVLMLTLRCLFWCIHNIECEKENS